MPSDRKITARVVDVVRHGTSANANPCYRVVLDDGTSYLTASDASVAYGIANPEFRGVPVELTLTPGGRIVHAKPLIVEGDTVCAQYRGATVRGEYLGIVRPGGARTGLSEVYLPLAATSVEVDSRTVTLVR